MLRVTKLKESRDRIIINKVMHENIAKFQMFQFCIFSNPLISLANWSLKCLTTWQVVNCQMVHRGSIRFQPRLFLIYRNSIHEKYYFRKNYSFQIFKIQNLKYRGIKLEKRFRKKKILIISILDRYRYDTVFDKDLEFSIMYFWNKTAYLE